MGKLNVGVLCLLYGLLLFIGLGFRFVCKINRNIIFVFKKIKFLDIFVFFLNLNVR